jgi:hypothetical protein
MCSYGCKKFTPFPDVLRRPLGISPNIRAIDVSRLEYDDNRSPRIECCLDGVAIESLYDSGSAMKVISRDFVDSL